MIPLTNLAQKIDQVEEQGHGLVLHDPGEGYQQPTNFRNGISKIS